MTRTQILAAAAAIAAALAGCATMMSDAEREAKALEVMKASFNARGQAGLDRLEQDETQALCSRYPGNLPQDVASKIEASNRATIKYPSNGKFLGDWRNGEKIAQSGVGKQFSDDPKVPAGGNCYACHQITPQEISFGTIGPPLLRYGARGNTPENQRYTWGKVYNADAYAACSNMPRFGHNGILTEDQIRDVVALLLDPDSPVNK